MKKNLSKIACGIAAISAIALVLSACESDSSPVICTCEPTESCNDRDISSSSAANSSAETETVESSADIESSAGIASSSSTEISSSTERIGRMEPGCFDIKRACPPCDENDCLDYFLPCNHCIGSLGDSIASCDGDGIYVCEANYWVKASNGQSGNTSSSSAVTITSSSTTSSSSAVASSSSAGRVGEKHEKCFEYERMCPPCNEEPCPIPAVACNDCGGMENDTLVECGSNDLYICKESYWESYCVHMKDSSGVAKADIPCHHEHAIAKDCDTDGTIICREGTWHALTENDSWVGEPCTEQGKIKTIPLDYKTVKGASFSINLRYYCNYGKWTEISTREPLSNVPCETGDSVTVFIDTYECIDETWMDIRRLTIGRADCSASPLIGADCTESDEWVYDVGCAYHCQDGKYILK